MGDSVELAPGNGFELAVEGPFAAALSGDNLITKAAQATKAANPDLRLGRFQLDKVLPVAAGLGGGSADAAAALRLIARANGGIPSEAELTDFATKLGSDVNVCLKSEPAMITGRGEKVEVVRDLPSCGVLLANPRVPLATAAVYGSLNAKPMASLPAQRPQRPKFDQSLEKLVAYILPRGNHLEPPAARLVPEIREVLAGLLALPGACVPRLSGSGPTCFALFAKEDEARRAAATLGAQRPTWWVAATTLVPS
jgi:4-diphosphocytidyl-2-C-methyl-D-erythritol kinase